MAEDVKLREDQHLLGLEPITESSNEKSFGSYVTRRTFVSGLGAVGLVATASPLAIASTPEGAAQPEDAVATTVMINGKSIDLAGLEARVTLLDLLRERLYLTGTKKGCDHG